MSNAATEPNCFNDLLREVERLNASLADTQIERIEAAFKCSEWKQRANQLTTELADTQQRTHAALNLASSWMHRHKHAHKAVAYYYSAIIQRTKKHRPAWVPSRVRVLRDVDVDAGGGEDRGPVFAGDYDCKCNSWGAVIVNGLGIKLNEFEILEWVENPFTATTPEG